MRAQSQAQGRRGADRSGVVTVRDAMTLASSTMTSLSLSETHARPVPHMAEAKI
jgi:hypothetical protein